MAGTVLKKRRLVNPGRRRHMTDKQIRFFGTARQKAALKNRRRHNRGGLSRSAKQSQGIRTPKWKYKAQQHARRRTAREERGGYVRRHNVAEILTVVPANPGGRRRSMAARVHHRRHRAHHRAHNRRHNRGRRHNYRTYNRRHNRRHNRRSIMNPRVIVRYRNRRHNRHRYGRRRNQGIMGAQMLTQLAGLFGGAWIIRMAQKWLPANFQTGLGGALGAAILGVLSGQVIARVLKFPEFGKAVMFGGIAVAAIDLADSFSFQLPLMLSPGTSGMGLLTSSNFYVPQVNVPGSMATFVAPAALPAPVVVPAGAKMSGLGYVRPGLTTMRRTGRMR